MTWLRRRAIEPGLDLGPSGSFESRFAGLVDRSFPSDADAIEQVRSRVLDAFVQHAPASAPARFGRPARRGLAVVLAVSASLGAFGAVAFGAEPGAPFYQVRLQVESATLPAVDTSAGWQARLDRLQRRIDESVGAAARVDSGAIGAALDEYRVELIGLARVSVDPVRRSALLTAAGRDLRVITDLRRDHPIASADLALGEIRAVVATIDGDPGVDEIRPGNPHTDGTTGDPHSDGTTGDPHTDGTTGNPHTDGTTGNPHTDGTTGDPHAGGTTGNPHTDGTTGNPHGAPKSAAPHSGGSSQSKGRSQGKPAVHSGKPAS